MMKPSLAQRNNKGGGCNLVTIAKAVSLLSLGLLVVVPIVDIKSFQIAKKVGSTDSNTLVDFDDALPSCDCEKKVESNSNAVETVQNEIPLPVQITGHYDEKRAAQLAARQIVAVPFEPYNTCNSKVVQVTCLRTLYLPKSKESHIPFVKELQKAVCDTLPAGKPKAHFLLCLQTSTVTGVLVARTNDSKTTNFDYLFSADAKYVEETAEAQVIDRKTVAMTGYYTPSSPAANEVRGKDQNVGNLIWQYGATHMLNPITTLIQPTSVEVADALIIATANCLNMETEGILDGLMGNYLNMMRAHRAPTVVLGMGMQADFHVSNVGNMKLFKAQKRLLDEMEYWQSTPAIGVRGETTASLCKNSGINNCVSMGCPSLTISHDLNLGKTLQTKWNLVLKRLENKERLTIALTLPAFSTGATGENAAYRDLLLNALGKIFLDHDCTFILQMPYDRLNVNRINELVVHKNATAFHTEIFDNFEAWSGFVKDHVDLVISTRIHGAMAGVSSGIPTVVVPTDYRIMELVTAMSLPHLTMDDVKKGKAGDVAAILKNARLSDMQLFEKNRRQKITQWRNMLESAGLEMNPGLLAIIDPSNKL